MNTQEAKDTRHKRTTTEMPSVKSRGVDWLPCDDAIQRFNNSTRISTAEIPAVVLQKDEQLFSNEANVELLKRDLEDNEALIKDMAQSLIEMDKFQDAYEDLGRQLQAVNKELRSEKLKNKKLQHDLDVGYGAANTNADLIYQQKQQIKDHQQEIADLNSALAHDAELEKAKKKSNSEHLEILRECAHDAVQEMHLSDEANRRLQEENARLRLVITELNKSVKENRVQPEREHELVPPHSGLMKLAQEFTMLKQQCVFVMNHISPDAMNNTALSDEHREVSLQAAQVAINALATKLEEIESNFCMWCGSKNNHQPSS